MQDRNARTHKREPYRPGTANKFPSSLKASSSSPEVSPDSMQRVKKWSAGFVKPDGTRIRLFVPPGTEA